MGNLCAFCKLQAVSINVERELLTIHFAIRSDDLGVVCEGFAVIAESQPLGDDDLTTIVKDMRLDHSGILFPMVDREATAWNPAAAGSRILSGIHASSRSTMFLSHSFNLEERLLRPDSEMLERLIGGFKCGFGQHIDKSVQFVSAHNSEYGRL